MTQLSCSLCDSSDIKSLFKKDGIPYYRCRNCDFLFSRPQSNANLENLIEDYNPAYIDYLEKSVVDDRNFDSFLKWMKQFSSFEGVSVLDVGTGSGKLVRFLRDRGIDAYGIEPAPSLYTQFLAKESFFFCKTIEEFSETLEEDSFDIVLACDVIEHVVRPDIFLEHVYQVIKPNGKLFISTPDAGSLMAQVCGKCWHFYHKYHLSYFSRETITALAGNYGFREVGFGRLSRLRSVGYILQYLSDMVIRSGRLKMPETIKNFAIPINLFDIMSVAFEKREKGR
jgi:2-polyprenyl-3-methyl-5-hydroxy-6-metoxy-1,4-benzoquinol methylase